MRASALMAASAPSPMRPSLMPASVIPVSTLSAPSPVDVDLDADTVVVEPSPRAEGSGLHRRPLVTEINLTVPVRR